MIKTGGDGNQWDEGHGEQQTTQIHKHQKDPLTHNTTE